MMPPRVSELRERIDMLEVTVPYGVDGSGTIISRSARGVRAKVVPTGGNPVDDTQQTQAYLQGYEIWIRYRDGVNAFQQINWEGTRLIQVAPPEEFSYKWILIHAQARIGRSI